MTSMENQEADQKVGGFVEEQIIARASRGIQKLPMLDVIFSRLATDLTSVLKARLGLLAEVDMGEVSYAPWGTAMSALNPHAICAVVNARQWDGGMVLALDPHFFHAAFEMQLSGRPDPKNIPERPPSTIERRMAKRISQVILAETAGNFARLSDVSFTVDAIETRQQATSMQSAIASCAIARITVRLGECEGDVHFVLPMSTLEPINPSLAKMFLGESLDGDSAWRNLLARRIDSSNVEVQAVLHHCRILISDMLAWKPGATIDLGIPADGDLTVTCTGIPILSASAGHRKNRMAMRIIGEHDNSHPEDPELGEEFLGLSEARA